MKDDLPILDLCNGFYIGQITYLPPVKVDQPSSYDDAYLFPINFVPEDERK